MSTFTNTSRSSAGSFTTTTKSGQSQAFSIAIGNPIGLLLALTYAETHSGSTPSIVWTNTTKS